jgi:mycofactocin precursor
MPQAATQLLDAPALVRAPGIELAEPHELAEPPELAEPAEPAAPAEPAEPAQSAAAGTDGEITGAGPDEIVAADLLVEEISIDGMCGVY